MVSAALAHDLEIFMVRIGSRYHRSYVLPSTLLNSTSLRRLSCSLVTSTLKVDAKNIAPRLTTLHLKAVNIVSGSPTVTFTFPVLETLSLQGHKWLNVESVEIHAPLLTTLWSTPAELYNKADYDYSIVIVAPRITTLDCRNTPEKIRVKPSPPSLVSACLSGQFYNHPDLHTLKEVGYRVRKLLNKCTSLEELFLNGCFVKESRIALPLCCHKLRRLTLCRNASFKLLFELLHAVPSLKFLCLDVCGYRSYKYEKLESIPACTASHLEEVVLCDFVPKAPQYDLLAKFLLKNAVQLKTFLINCQSDPEPKMEEQIIKRLSAMPRCLTSPKIELVDWFDLEPPMNDGFTNINHNFVL